MFFLGFKQKKRKEERRPGPGKTPLTTTNFLFNN